MTEEATVGQSDEIDGAAADDTHKDVREELLRVLGDDAFPADKDTLRTIALDNGAEDGPLRLFEALEENRQFQSINDLIDNLPKHRSG
jgi:hypothetical protein